MKPTIEFAKLKFEAFNALIFHDALPLPLPAFRIGTARTQLGSMMRKKEQRFMGLKCTYSYRLTLSCRYDLPEQEWEDVIIHEMIHYYIFVNNLKDTSAHGKLFRGMMQKINATYGRNITVSHSAKNLECKEKSTATTKRMSHWFCIAELQNGQWGVCVVPRSRIFQMWRDIPKHFRTKSVRWFWGMSPLLNKYPKSLKPCLYKTTKEEADQCIADAMELKNTGTTIMPIRR